MALTGGGWPLCERRVLAVKSGALTTLGTADELRLRVGGEVHIWIGALDGYALSRGQLPTLLSADEIVRSERFHFDRDRHRFITGRALLRELLGSYLRCAPNELRFTYGPSGKPALTGRHARLGLRFNVSHTHGTVLFALARGRELGVDIERHPAPDDGDAVARHFFAPAEVRRLHSLPADERSAGFLRCWTRKEAYVKARGDGLSLALDSFEVSLEPRVPASLLATHHDPGEARRWSMIDLTHHVPGHFAAVAIAGAQPVLRVGHLSSPAIRDTWPHALGCRKLVSAC